MSDMGETIRDVILRITGDGDDARRELERLSRDLTRFGRKDAEANAKIDTAKAKADLKALERQFERIDGRDLTATAKVRLGKALADVAALQAMLADLDGQDVEIDVKLRKDIEDRMQSLGMRAAGFADALGNVEKKGRGVGEALDGTNVQMGFFSTKASNALKILPALIPVLVGVIAQVIALGASASMAVAGLGALAVAAGGALAAAVAIGVAAFVRFKETMDTAGTPANRIVGIVEKIGEAMAGLSKAADPILHAIADNLGGVFDVIERVRPAFFELGKAAGEAIGWMIKALTSSGMADAIGKLLELAGPVMKPLVQILVYFGRLMLNIANATMPFLTSALQGLAKWLGEVAKGTSDIAETRGTIGQMIGHLKSWWNLLVQIAGVFGQLVRIAAPFGKVMVDSLAEGAENLKEWLASSEGTKRVAQFFKDVLPLADQVVAALGKIVVIILQFGQIVAPALEPMVKGTNEVLDVLIALQELVLKIPAPIRGMIGTILSLVFGFGKLKVAGAGVKAAIGLVAGALGVLGGALSGAWNAVQTFVGQIPGYVRDRLEKTRDDVVALAGGARDAAVAIWGAIKDAAGAIWGAIVDSIKFRIELARDAVTTGVKVMRDVATAVWHGIREAAASIFNSVREAIVNRVQGARDQLVNVVHGMRDAATNVWHAIRDAASAIFGAVKDAITSRIQAAREAVSNAVNAMRDVATTVWHAIRDAAATIFGSVKDAIANALGNAKDSVSNIVSAMLGVITGMAGRFYAAGKSLIQAMIDGFMSLANSLYDAIKSVASKATDLLPGSEPKDKSSPFAGLKKRGAAIIRNLVDGVERAGPELVDSLARHFANAAAAGPPGLALAGGQVGGAGAVAATSGAPSLPAPVATGRRGAGGGTVIEEQNINVTPIADGGSPDPEVLAAQLSSMLRNRGS